jgi:hypothetical protein
MFRMGQSGGFPGGAARHKAMNASLDLPLDQGPVGLFIEPAVLEGSNDSGECSL